MKKAVMVLASLPLTTWAHGDHDFHDGLTQTVHGLGHADVLGAIVVLGVLVVCVARYLKQRQ